MKSAVAKPPIHTHTYVFRTHGHKKVGRLELSISADRCRPTAHIIPIDKISW